MRLPLSKQERTYGHSSNSDRGNHGNTITPVNVQSHTGAAVAGTSAKGLTETRASTTSATLVRAESANMAAGLLYRPDVAGRIVLEPGERFQLECSNPADSLTMNATLVFQEITAPTA